MPKKQKKEEEKEGIKRKKPTDISCQFCQVFYDVSRDDRDDKGNRYCPFKRQYVYLEDNSCNQFAPSELFWCRQIGFWSDVKICLSKFHKGKENCSFCLQARQLYLYYCPPNITYNIIGAEEEDLKHDEGIHT